MSGMVEVSGVRNCGVVNVLMVGGYFIVLGRL